MVFLSKQGNRIKINPLKNTHGPISFQYSSLLLTSYFGVLKFHQTLISNSNYSMIVTRTTLKDNDSSVSPEKVRGKFVYAITLYGSWQAYRNVSLKPSFHVWLVQCWKTGSKCFKNSRHGQGRKEGRPGHGRTQSEARCRRRPSRHWWEATCNAMKVRHGSESGSAMQVTWTNWLVTCELHQEFPNLHRSHTCPTCTQILRRPLGWG